jgi:hypothetical protein
VRYLNPQSGIAKDSVLPKWYDVLLGELFQNFQRLVVLLSSSSPRKLLEPKDEGTTILRDVEKCE